MNRTSIRKYIIALALQYIVLGFDKTNTDAIQNLIVSRNNDTYLRIDRNCYMGINPNAPEYFEDYKIDFDGIVNMTRVKSLFYIEWDNQLNQM